MNIVLGIFDGYFYDVAKLPNNCSYPFDELDPNIWERFNDIISIVYFAARKADKIIFIIDGLQPNITGYEDSYTCKELITLLSSPRIPLIKFEFMFEREIVSAEFVQERLNLSKELFS
jgi:hypothetical protein